MFDDDIDCVTVTHGDEDVEYGGHCESGAGAVNILGSGGLSAATGGGLHSEIEEGQLNSAADALGDGISSSEVLCS